jgi:hypothetical protein
MLDNASDHAEAEKSRDVPTRGGFTRFGPAVALGRRRDIEATRGNSRIAPRRFLIQATKEQV